MRRFLISFVFTGLYLLRSLSANAATISPEDVAFITSLAENSNIGAQYNLARFYAPSYDHDSKEDESVDKFYFWSSICTDNFKSSGRADTEKSQSDFKVPFISGDLYRVSGFMNVFENALLKDCQKFKAEAEKSLDQGRLKKLDKDVLKWQKEHPPVVLSESQKAEKEKHDRLNQRLSREIAGGKYDLSGIEKLIKAGAVKDGGDMTTSIMKAIDGDRRDVAERLIGTGLDVNTKVFNTTIKNLDSYSPYVATPFRYAQAKKRAEIAQMLINAGADAKEAQDKVEYFKCSTELHACPDGSLVPRAGESCDFMSCETKTSQARKKDPSSPSVQTEEALLKSPKAEDRQKAMEKILSAPEKYGSTTLLALSDALFHQYRDEEAAFWHIAAVWEEAYPYFFCARTFYNAFNLFGPRPHRDMNEFNTFMAEYPDKMPSIIDNALDWDRKIPHEYAPPESTNSGECYPQNVIKEHMEDFRQLFAADAKSSFGDMRNPLTSFPDASQLLLKANAGDAESQYTLACCYDRTKYCNNMESTGVHDDSYATEAHKWFSMAADHGLLAAKLKIYDREKWMEILAPELKKGNLVAYRAMTLLEKNDPLKHYAWTRLLEDLEPNLFVRGSRLQLDMTMSKEDLAKANPLYEEYKKMYEQKK